MSYRDEQPQVIACCVHLRSKTMYFTPGERPGRLCYSEERTYWCSQTQSPEGPDEQAANPPLCQSGRKCYRAEE